MFFILEGGSKTPIHCPFQLYQLIITSSICRNNTVPCYVNQSVTLT